MSLFQVSCGPNEVPEPPEIIIVVRIVYDFLHGSVDTVCTLGCPRFAKS